MMQRMLTVIAILLVFAFSPPARANCKIGEATNLPGGPVPQYIFDTTGDAAIPVYLVVTNPTILGKTPALVERAIGRAIEAINRYSYSGARLIYQGQVQALPTPGSYGIFIREDTSCSGCGSGNAIACAKPPLRKANPLYVQNILIHLVYNPGTCPQHNWQFYPDFSGTDDTQSVVTHELLHALGLAHAGNAGNCPTKASDVGTDGIMATFGSQFTDQRYLSRDDVEGLVDLYLPRLGELDYQWSTDGVTWTDGVLLNDLYVESAVGSASTALGGETNMWFSYREILAPSWIPKLREMPFASAGTDIPLYYAELWDRVCLRT